MSGNEELFGKKNCKILKFVLCDLMNWNDFVNNFILCGGNF